MKNVNNWKAMSSIGVIGISMSSGSRLRTGSPSPGSVHVTSLGGAHGLEVELAEPLGLAGLDQAEQLREAGRAVGPHDDGRGQAHRRINLHAGGPGIEL